MISFKPSLLPLALCLLSVTPAEAARQPKDLESIKAEPNLERRSRSALHFARTSVNLVLKAYEKGEPERGIQLLVQIQEAVELAYDSLIATGKNARKKPKHFKHAEIQTRNLLKQLAALRRNLNYDEREAVEAVRSRVSAINDQLLMAIMSKKKK